MSCHPFDISQLVKLFDIAFNSFTLSLSEVGFESLDAFMGLDRNHTQTNSPCILTLDMSTSLIEGPAFTHRTVWHEDSVVANLTETSCSVPLVKRSDNVFNVFALPPISGGSGCMENDLLNWYLVSSA